MMTTTRIGTTMKSGEPFNFAQQELNDLNSRLRLLCVVSIIGFVYLLLSLLVGPSLPGDLLMLIGTVFLVYRAYKVSEERDQIKQYLHGEGVLALT